MVPGLGLHGIMHRSAAMAACIDVLSDTIYDTLGNPGRYNWAAGVQQH